MVVVRGVTEMLVPQSPKRGFISWEECTASSMLRPGPREHPEL